MGLCVVICVRVCGSMHPLSQLLRGDFAGQRGGWRGGGGASWRPGSQVTGEEGWRGQRGLIPKRLQSAQ